MVTVGRTPSSARDPQVALFEPNSRRVTCYEHIRSEVEQCGGTYVTEQAVRDGNILSAQTWESHPDFYREIFRCLRHAESA